MGRKPKDYGQDHREELEEFAKMFRSKRLVWGLTQDQVGGLVGLKYGTEFSQTTVSRFEALEMPTNSMRKVYEMIRSWYDDIEKYITPGIDPNLLVKVLTEASINSKPADMSVKIRKKRTTFSTQTLETLEALFRANRQPTQEEQEKIAESLDLKFNEVRVWFCNRRQREKKTFQQKLLYNDDSGHFLDASLASACSSSDSSASANSPPSISPPTKMRKVFLATPSSNSEMSLKRKSYIISSVPILDSKSSLPISSPISDELESKRSKQDKVMIVKVAPPKNTANNSPQAKFPVSTVASNLVVPKSEPVCVPSTPASSVSTSTTTPLIRSLAHSISTEPIKMRVNYVSQDRKPEIKQERLEKIEITPIVNRPQKTSFVDKYIDDEEITLIKSPNEFLKHLVRLAAQNQGVNLNDGEDSEF
ncbi:hypothetical protein WR25_10728 [Diploscapter pachys]|uniref:POU domain protein n=1 Tax=Diploscapter pachys TaxID=2018661 RepID=A0A2A2KMQ4_9BILA|nr:hypothetical protein WR25_10728 [Diploscapter pachys]